MPVSIEKRDPGTLVRIPGSRANTLEELLADQIAAAAVEIAEERIREMFEVTEFDLDKVFGFMASEQATEFLGLPYTSFREIAPSLPRHAITLARFGYLIPNPLNRLPL